jgi:isopentenyldiphosphate isomerase
MSRVVVVDSSDNVIGLKTYAELTYKDIYRVTALWLTDLTKTHCLITQRKWNKHNDPGKWMMAVSGTVEEGEGYDSNIEHEVVEEIGLEGVKVQKVDKSFVDDGLHRFFVQFYTAKIDMATADITIQEDEVEQYQWVSIIKLVAWVQEKPEDFVPSMKDSLKIVGAYND